MTQIEILRLRILERLMATRGVYAAIARNYLGDETKSEGFILECFMQCHNPYVWKNWGVELVLDIVRYRLLCLRQLHEACLRDMTQQRMSLIK